MTTLLERRHGIVHFLFNKKVDMYFTNWSRSLLNCMNLRLFNKLYLVIDINRMQELCVKCITKDCHVRLYVFNMINHSKTVVLQCNMALIWWLKMCFMLTMHTYIHMLWYEMFSTTLLDMLFLYKSWMGHCCAGFGSIVYKLRQSVFELQNNICQISNVNITVYIMKETLWT